MPSPQQIAVFDLETTGVDVENDRIVTAFVGLMNADGQLIESTEWIIDPGVEIPEGASNVHGITTARAQAEGRKDVDKAVFEIMQKIDIYDRAGIPVTIYNAPYDLTLLDREVRRHCGVKNFRPPRIVIDPFVLDKAVDRYRKGPRKLVNVAAHYGVKVLENAHDAKADCIMTGQVALRVLQHPSINHLSLAAIHEKSIAQKEVQQKGFRAYLYAKADRTLAEDLLEAGFEAELAPSPELVLADLEEKARTKHLAERESIKDVRGDWPWRAFPGEEPEDG